ncbi:MoaD/ThiS family protein [Brachybacterium sp. GCM10030267]|uniref:MoaD/ThiS family protein n=1 Tax=unclassified Brachybacterium TaxID=2623841 RepID=UPI0036174D5B
MSTPDLSDAGAGASGAGNRTALPTITVRLFAGAAAEYGADTASAHGSSVQDAIDDLLSTATPQAARVIGRSSFLVNAVACTDRSRPLTDGDRLDVLPPFAGG